MSIAEAFAVGSAIAGSTAGGILLGAGVLHLIPKLGGTGKRLSDRLCGGFPLDVMITYFTVLPLFLGPIIGGWAGLIGAVVGQLVGLIVWEVIHEFIHRNTHGRAKLLKATNKLVGPVRNLAAVFWTAWCVPLFWIVRVAEYFVYTPLIWWVNFPKYNQREWVNVSRHKFQGLVGHDRIWCLYCDWMTGVWSLGTEMLRNVESFWCPVRFSTTAKCDNCTIDFPDIDNGWVPADGTMDDVDAVFREKYVEKDPGLPNAWFGHPSRKPVKLTVNGNPAEKESV